MIIHFNNKDYRFDLEDITVEDARAIKRYCGLTLKGLEEGLSEADPDAMTCLYWLMLRQNGEDHNIERVSFKVIKFAAAFAAANTEDKPVDSVPKGEVTAPEA